MIDTLEPVIVGFPLRGEWLLPNTPGSRIPSHGTDRLGTRYAYDFIQVDWNRPGKPAYRASLARYLLSGLRLSDYYCWGKEIYAPCDGAVVAAGDGYPENTKTSLFADMSKAYRIARNFDPARDDVRTVAGNYVIIKLQDKVYAALCHLQTGSVRPSVGDWVSKGERIGRIGHSGNSFGPHLHFQLMDDSDITRASGIPCAFEEYEVLRSGTWIKEERGIPTSQERVRFL